MNLSLPFLLAAINLHLHLQENLKSDSGFPVRIFVKLLHLGISHDLYTIDR